MYNVKELPHLPIAISCQQKKLTVSEGPYNPPTDYIFCKRTRKPFKGHTNKNCPVRIAYRKDKLGENYTESENYNRDHDTTQSGQTYSKSTSIPAPGQQRSRYPSQNIPSTNQNKYSKSTHNNNRGLIRI